jgi:hypothetical protein
VTFDETNLPLSSTASFITNRIVSSLNTNLPGTSPFQGHFIIVSLHEYGTNIMMFGTGEYRSGDIFLCMTPTTHFADGAGTVYFTGLTNGQPTWSPFESNCVPVVQDNPTNGPAWPNDDGSVGNVSVIYPPSLGLWLMTYDGGRSADSAALHTTGVYFSYAPYPWGPWTTPQLIFNKLRDGGSGVFIHDPNLGFDDGLDGPVIGVDADPSNTPGGDFAPIMIERFTRLTNSTLCIYYTMSTWNPYTVVKMRSAFTITPVIDLGSLEHKKGKFSFAWVAPTNQSYRVDYSANLADWTTFTDLVTSTSGIFSFTNTQGGGLPTAGFYRVRAEP